MGIANKQFSLKCEFCGLKKITTKTGMKIHSKCCIKNPNRVNGSSFGKTYSEEILNKSFRNNPNQGGLRKGSGRGKKGWYKGFYCRSTWELAWLVYQLDHGENIKSCKEYFEYYYKGKKHKYYPDFIWNNNYVEIKGWRYPNTKEKLEQFPSDKKLLLIEGKKEIKKFDEYAFNKYGKNYHIKLYEN